MHLNDTLDEFKKIVPTADDLTYLSMLGDACLRLKVDGVLHLSMNRSGRSTESSYSHFIYSSLESYRCNTTKPIDPSAFDQFENQLLVQSKFSTEPKGRLMQFEQNIKFTSDSLTDDQIESSVFLFSLDRFHVDAYEIQQRSYREFQFTAQILHLHMTTIYRNKNCRRANSNLTDREVVVLQKSGQGKTYCDIGNDLNISSRTVRFFLESARHKLGCLNTTHAVATALQLGLL
jgi:DNA-binding CsgD family transcriptional regulator